MSYSIVIIDPNEEAIGIGVTSKFKEDVGAIATQALAYGIKD